MFLLRYLSPQLRQVQSSLMSYLKFQNNQVLTLQNEDQAYVCVGACVRACVGACVRACVCACVRACARVRASACVSA